MATQQVTAADQADQAQPTSQALDPTARMRARRLRRPVLLLALVLLVAAAVAVGRSGQARGYLDPDAATPQGARALRVLLEEQGVTVSDVTSSSAALAAAKAGDTLLVATPDDANEGQLAQLASSPADLVLVDPSPDALVRLAPWLQVVESAPAQVRDAECALPAALRAGRAVTGGLTFDGQPPAGGTAFFCYAVGGGATVAQAQLPGGRTVTVLGSGYGLTNDQLAQEGNAALALNLLGAHSKLVWYVVAPSLAGDTGTKSLGQLLPGWVRPTELQLLIAVLLLALWQGRRFGPVVEEPLPVVVRAAEATEGRARLYRRAGARDRAAQNLRAATVARIVPLVGQSGSATPAEVTEAVAGRTGRASAEVGALLYGSASAAPATDAALVQLANELDALERMVRHP
jgi:Domain of unknown function (DUF4350)